MCKAILWIDDSTDGIMNIVESIFPYFWDLSGNNGIETHIRIIGNNMQDAPALDLWSEEDEQQYRADIMNIFQQLCRDNDRLGDKNLYEKRKNLICDNIRIMYKQEDKDIDEYRQLCQMWQNTSEITKQNHESAQSLVQKMEIPEGACVGLDLALLQGDIENVRDKNKPILSMELYHIIKEKHECFLYSNYVFDTSFINEWKKVYSEKYDDTTEPIIHKRSEMYIKNISENLIKELIDLVNKSYERGSDLP